MHIREFKVCNSVGSSYAQRIPKETWEHYRAFLTALHERGLTRLEIIRTAQREHGFRPSPGQLNLKFKEWGLKVYGGIDMPENNDCNFRRRTLSDQTPAESSTSVRAPSGQDHLYNRSSSHDGISLNLTNDAVQANMSQSQVEVTTPANENLNAENAVFVASDPQYNRDYDDLFLEFDETLLTNPIHPPPQLHQENRYGVQEDTTHLSASPNDDNIFPLPTIEDDSSLMDNTHVGGETSLEDESSLRIVSKACIPINSWFEKVHPCQSDNHLHATLDLAGFFHSSRLCDHAFLTYKHLYTELSLTLPPDDLLRLGVLVNCARFVPQSEDLEVRFVTDALRSSIDWCSRNWSSTYVRIGQRFQLYLNLLLTNLTRDSNSNSLQEKPPESFEQNRNELDNLYHSLSNISTGCQRILAHIVLPTDKVDPVTCPHMFDTISGLVQWAFRCVSFSKLEIDGHFLSSRTRNPEEKWNTIRRICLHLISEATGKSLAVFLGESTWLCKCGFCPTIESLVGDCLSETCTALACIIYEQIDNFLWNSIQGEVSILKFDARSSFVEYAVRNIRATTFRASSPEETYKHLSVLRDFFSAYRSCFESTLSLKDEAQIHIAEQVMTDAQLTIRKAYRLDTETCRIGLSQSVETAKPSVPASQWLKKLSIRSQASGMATATGDNSQLKRNRSAVSSILTGSNSRTSSLRSFEHFAKKLKQRSNPSTQSIMSQVTSPSRTSSHHSWRFDAVTGFSPVSENVLQDVQDRGPEEREPPEDAPPPYEEFNDAHFQAGQGHSRLPPAYRLRSATVPLLSLSTREHQRHLRPRSSSLHIIDDNDEFSTEAFDHTLSLADTTPVAPDFYGSPSSSTDDTPLTLDDLNELSIHDGPILQVAHF